MPRLGPGTGGNGDQDVVPAGIYIVALKGFKRATGKTSGADYLRCRWAVCDGPLEGKGFWSNISLNLSKEGTVNRWRVLMEACNVNEEIELGSSDEGNAAEGDANIREWFLNRPIKVTVKTEKNGNYVNHDLEMIHYVRTWTDADKAAMDRWLDALESRGGQSSGGGQQRDDWNDGAGGSQKKADDFDQDYGPPGGGTQTGGFAGGDDDIPF